jgi:hypothetical protein
MAENDTYDRETVYQGIYQRFARMEVPPCPRCGTCNTASVQVGVIGLTIRLAATCSKFKLIPNGPKPGNWFCNTCGKFFDVAYDCGESGTRRNSGNPENETDPTKGTQA